MSTIEIIDAKTVGNVPKAGQNASDSFIEIPNCTIEDIDRSVFNLFDSELPLLYEFNKQTRRVPIVFASGERFATLSRKKPLRDKNNALILPIISIMRDSVSVENDMGLPSNQAVPHVIRKSISRKDAKYQRLRNKLNLRNSDDMPSDNSFIDSNHGEASTGAKPGRLSSRRPAYSSLGVRRDSLLEQEINDNIIEVFEMPPPQFLTISYDVVIWAQYIQQMNEIIMSIVSSAQNFNQRTFRLETPKGYTFVAYVNPGFSPNSNFDEFTNEERLVKESFSLKVPAYILGETYKGAPNRVRVAQSAPNLTFEMNFVNGKIEDNNSPKNSFAKDYVFDDRKIESSLPGQTISKNISRNKIQDGSIDGSIQDTALIGEATNDVTSNENFDSHVRGGSGTPPRTEIVTEDVNPFTGMKEERRSYLATRTSRNGETIYREIF